MHLKRNDVVGSDICLLQADSLSSTPQNNNNNNNNNNNTTNPDTTTTTSTTHNHHHNNEDPSSTTTSTTSTTNHHNNDNHNNDLATPFNNHHYKNNYNNHNLGAAQDEPDKPLLIVDSGSVEEGCASLSVGSRTSTSAGVAGVEDGMTTSPASSLPDLSENVSCSSDRLHHPSISSSIPPPPPHHLLHHHLHLPPPRSSSTGSLSSYDESDLESCSSLEVDLHEGKANVDLDITVYRSRWGSNDSDHKTSTYSHFNDLSPISPLVPLSHNVDTGSDKTFYDKPKLHLLPGSPSLVSPTSYANGNLVDGIDNFGIDEGLVDAVGNYSQVSGDENCSNTVENYGENFVDTDDNINSVGCDNFTGQSPIPDNVEDSSQSGDLNCLPKVCDSPPLPRSAKSTTHSSVEGLLESPTSSPPSVASPLPESPESPAFSDDDGPSDIEQRMAETEVKMNDAILSNGKEELDLHGHKLKQYMKHREASGTIITNNNNNNNQNNNNNHNLQQLESLKLKQNLGDNRLKSNPESPIVDAYEKECLDQPEKMVKELENQAKEGSVKDTSLEENNVEENNIEENEDDNLDESVNTKESQLRESEDSESDDIEVHMNEIPNEEVDSNEFQEEEVNTNITQGEVPLVNGIQNEEAKINEPMLDKTNTTEALTDISKEEHDRNEDELDTNVTQINETQSNETVETELSNAVEPPSLDAGETENSDTVEPKSSDTVKPESSEPTEPNSSEAVELENSKTVEPENSETAELGSSETAEPENSETAEPGSSETAEPENSETTEPQNTETVPDPFVPYRRGRREREARRRRDAASATAAAANASTSDSPGLSPSRRISAPPATTDRSRPSRVTFEESVLQRVARREGLQQTRRRHMGLGGRHFRRSVPQAPSTGAASKGRLTSPDTCEFDVYTMETALPKIDWEAIESHLKVTREEERRRRNDREEIRRKLAMGCDDDAALDRPHRKPSLHSRLQSGMNLQICFMNETASDCESQCSDTESTQDIPSSTNSLASKCSRGRKSRKAKVTRRIMPQDSSDPDQEDDEEDEEEEEEEEEEQTAGGEFLKRQAQLQAEARVALAQAKEMARMQMEIEKQSKKKSPIADIVRASFNKIGVPFPDSKRRISRQILTDMNVAQLQVIVNDLHTQIESLNEELVTFLMERDDLHMEQDSMLVDIEDLTKHIGAKELCVREDNNSTKTSSPAPTPPPSTRSIHTPPPATRTSTPPLSSTLLPLKARAPGKLRGIVKK